VQAIPGISAWHQAGWKEQSGPIPSRAHLLFPFSLCSPVLAGRLQFFIKNGRSSLKTLGYKMTFSSTRHQERIPKAVVSREGGLFTYHRGDSISPPRKGQLSNQVKDQSLTPRGFTFPKKGGEHCPIINLKASNRFIPHVHFKVEGIQSLRELILQGDFMIKLDLKDAYSSIPIHTIHQRFLGFMWEGQSYQFTCLCFGLSSAPCTFTKVMKPLMAYLRLPGIRLVIYFWTTC